MQTNFSITSFLEMSAFNTDPQPEPSLCVSAKISDVAVATLNKVEVSASPQTPKRKVEDVALLTSASPSEWFPLSRNTKGRIKFDIPSHLRKKQRLIYIFRNKVKNCFLIGKTGCGLAIRCARYATLFNRNKNSGTESPFLKDVKENPEHFEVGVLHILKPEEDLDQVEASFIQYKGETSSLYNQRTGGGGGLAHTEESPITYAVPKPGTLAFTPSRYYSYYKDEQGRIRPKLTPGIREKIKKQQRGAQQCVYVIKRKASEHDIQEKRYIGISGDPEKRARQHAYAAQKCDPESPHFDPDHIGGALHPAMAENPEQFEIGLLPVQVKEEIAPEKQDDYLFLSSIATVESYSILIKESFEKGFNCNRGGGGPLSRRVKRLVLE